MDAYEEDFIHVTDDEDEAFFQELRRLQEISFEKFRNQRTPNKAESSKREKENNDNNINLNTYHSPIEDIEIPSSKSKHFNKRKSTKHTNSTMAKTKTKTNTKTKDDTPETPISSGRAQRIRKKPKHLDNDDFHLEFGYKRRKSTPALNVTAEVKDSQEEEEQQQPQQSVVAVTPAKKSKKVTKKELAKASSSNDEVNAVAPVDAKAVEEAEKSVVAVTPAKKSKKVTKKKLAKASSSSDEVEAVAPVDATAAEQDQQIYCICRGVHGGLFMLYCDSCDQWFHGHCIGIKESKSRDLEGEFFCNDCVIGIRSGLDKQTLVEKMRVKLAILDEEKAQNNVVVAAAAPPPVKKRKGRTPKASLPQAKEVEVVSSAEEETPETNGIGKKRRKSANASATKADKRSKKEDAEKLRLESLIDQSKSALKQKQRNFGKRKASSDRQSEASQGEAPLPATDMSMNEVAKKKKKKKKTQPIDDSADKLFSPGESPVVRRTLSTSSSTGAPSTTPSQTSNNRRMSSSSNASMPPLTPVAHEDGKCAMCNRSRVANSKSESDLNNNNGSIKAYCSDECVEEHAKLMLAAYQKLNGKANVTEISFINRAAAAGGGESSKVVKKFGEKMAPRKIVRYLRENPSFEIEEPKIVLARTRPSAAGGSQPPPSPRARTVAVSKADVVSSKDRKEMVKKFHDVLVRRFDNLPAESKKKAKKYMSLHDLATKIEDRVFVEYKQKYVAKCRMIILNFTDAKNEHAIVIMLGDMSLDTFFDEVRAGMLPNASRQKEAKEDLEKTLQLIERAAVEEAQRTSMKKGDEEGEKSKVETKDFEGLIKHVSLDDPQVSSAESKVAAASSSEPSTETKSNECSSTTSANSKDSKADVVVGVESDTATTTLPPTEEVSKTNDEADSNASAAAAVVKEMGQGGNVDNEEDKIVASPTTKALTPTLIPPAAIVTAAADDDVVVATPTTPAPAQSSLNTPPPPAAVSNDVADTKVTTTTTTARRDSTSKSEKSEPKRINILNTSNVDALLKDVMGRALQPAPKPAIPPAPSAEAAAAASASNARDVFSRLKSIWSGHLNVRSSRCTVKAYHISGKIDNFRPQHAFLNEIGMTHRSHPRDAKKFIRAFRGGSTTAEVILIKFVAKSPEDQKRYDDIIKMLTGLDRWACANPSLHYKNFYIVPLLKEQQIPSDVWPSTDPNEDLFAPNERRRNLLIGVILRDLSPRGRSPRQQQPQPLQQQQQPRESPPEQEEEEEQPQPEQQSPPPPKQQPQPKQPPTSTETPAADAAAPEKESGGERSYTPPLPEARNVDTGGGHGSRMRSHTPPLPDDQPSTSTSTTATFLPYEPRAPGGGNAGGNGAVPEYVPYQPSTSHQVPTVDGSHLSNVGLPNVGLPVISNVGMPVVSNMDQFVTGMKGVGLNWDGLKGIISNLGKPENTNGSNEQSADAPPQPPAAPPAPVEPPPPPPPAPVEPPPPPPPAPVAPPPAPVAPPKAKADPRFKNDIDHRRARPPPVVEQPKPHHHHHNHHHQGPSGHSKPSTSSAGGGGNAGLSDAELSRRAREQFNAVKMMETSKEMQRAQMLASAVVNHAAAANMMPAWGAGSSNAIAFAGAAPVMPSFLGHQQHRPAPPQRPPTPHQQQQQPPRTNPQPGFGRMPPAANQQPQAGGSRSATNQPGFGRMPPATNQQPQAGGSRSATNQSGFGRMPPAVNQQPQAGGSRSATNQPGFGRMPPATNQQPPPAGGSRSTAVPNRPGFVHMSSTTNNNNNNQQQPQAGASRSATNQPTTRPPLSFGWKRPRH